MSAVLAPSVPSGHLPRCAGEEFPADEVALPEPPQVVRRKPRLSPRDESLQLAERMAAAAVPLIEERLAVLMSLPSEADFARAARERKLMAACKAVGAAYDRLMQARYTAGEPAARMSLERKAKTLRGLLPKGAV